MSKEELTNNKLKVGKKGKHHKRNLERH